MATKIPHLRPGVSLVDTRIAQPLPTSLAFSDDRRGSSASRGYGWEWQKLRAQIMKRDGYRCRCDDCAASGAILPAHAVDHRTPKSQGGTDDPSNLQAINRDCHAKKTARDSRGHE